MNDVIKNKELDLIERLIEGDEDAFCALYMEYKPKLLRFSISLLKSREAAEDICQDIFITIWENRRFIKSDCSFSAYLFSIARNRILNFLRDEICHNKILEDLYSHSLDYDEGTKQEIEKHDLLNHIQLAMKKLSVRQRECFEMSRYQHLLNKEIAERLGISISTVQDHIYTSLKIIRKYFRDELSLKIGLMIVLRMFMNR